MANSNTNLASAFRIRALTNMHPGSGDSNFGIIDNLVQRDALTGLPCIHASSLKGAIKQFFDHHKMDKGIQRKVFGSDAEVNKDSKTKTSRGNNQTGEYTFITAQLLGMPVRSDYKPYFLATCPLVLGQFLELAGKVGAVNTSKALFEKIKKAGEGLGEGNALWLHSETKKCWVEDEELNCKPLQLNEAEQQTMGGLFKSQPLLIVTNSFFAKCCDDEHLPVVARNALDDGRSTNLFYEQVLPREVQLAFFILKTNASDGVDLAQWFGNGLVQIGGNATVGYGFCEIEPLN